MTKHIKFNYSKKSHIKFFEEKTDLRICIPLMIPEKKMLRYLPQRDRYYHCGFSKEEIYKYYLHLETVKIKSFEHWKYFTLGHGGKIYKGAEVISCFILDENNREKIPAEMNLPIGSLVKILKFNTYLDLVWFQNLYPNGCGASISGTFEVTDENGDKHLVYEEFERINKGKSNLPFNVYVRGGETGGKGRNEHGDAHFELLEPNTNNLICKIYMPTKNKWSSFSNKLDLLIPFEGDLPKKDKKKLEKWLSENNNENLTKSHNSWNENNKHNNRTNKIN